MDNSDRDTIYKLFSITEMKHHESIMPLQWPYRKTQIPADILYYRPKSHNLQKKKPSMCQTKSYRTWLMTSWPYMHLDKSVFTNQTDEQHTFSLTVPRAMPSISKNELPSIYYPNPQWNIDWCLFIPFTAST